MFQSTRVPMVDAYGAQIRIQGYVFLSFDSVGLTNGQVRRPGANAFWFPRSVVARLHHDPNLLLARTEDGLRVGQDGNGVWASVPLFQDALCEGALACVKAGAFGWSCEYELEDEEIRRHERIVRSAKLDEVTLTARPAAEQGATWSTCQNDRDLSAHVIEQRNSFRKTMASQNRRAVGRAPIGVACGW